MEIGHFADKKMNACIIPESRINNHPLHHVAESGHTNNVFLP